MPDSDPKPSAVQKKLSTILFLLSFLYPFIDYADNFSVWKNQVAAVEQLFEQIRRVLDFKKQGCLGFLLLLWPKTPEKNGDSSKLIVL